jgi:hypothetical protein
VAILKNHQGSWFRSVVLRGNIHVVTSNSAWENLAVFPGVVGEDSLGDAIVPQGIRAEGIACLKRRFLGPEQARAKVEQQEAGDSVKRVHGKK